MEENYYYYCGGGGGNNINKRISGHIPTFGNWDFTDDLPITQYFECARQAGLVRYSSSGECDPRADLYSVAVDPPQKPPRSRAAAALSASASRKANEKRRPHVKEHKKGGRICDMTQQPPKMRHMSENHKIKSKLQSDAVPYPRPRVTNKPPKAVDEDLYKISPELLNRKKKKLGFISRCLVPACSA